MTSHEAVSTGAAASPPCTGIFCAPHYLVKVLLVALFMGLAGSWAYCEAGQPMTMESSLDMSDVPAMTSTF
jgi:hypothetical protein